MAWNHTNGSKVNAKHNDYLNTHLWPHYISFYDLNPCQVSELPKQSILFLNHYWDFGHYSVSLPNCLGIVIRLQRPPFSFYQKCSKISFSTGSFLDLCFICFHLSTLKLFKTNKSLRLRFNWACDKSNSCNQSTWGFMHWLELELMFGKAYFYVYRGALLQEVLRGHLPSGS